jgi:membrane protein implicated in regulation of membrane protease activity
MSAAIWWFLIGGALIAAEVAVVTGIGLLFTGLGALSVGLLIESGVMANSSLAAQIGVALAATGAWAIVLWKPFKSMIAKRPGKSYSNMVGEMAEVVGSPITGNAEGKAKWSGAVMGAKLADEFLGSTLDVGQKAEIVEVKGNTLILRPNRG